MATALADERIEPTVTPEAAAARVWDVLVIGAGPAGAVAAALLARRGLSVLLIERHDLPRAKVCGGCISAAALEVLQAAGLGAMLPEADGPVLRRAVIIDAGRRVCAPLPGGRALSRRVLDACLTREALAAGAALFSRASAGATRLEEGRRLVQVRPAGHLPVEIAARVVLSAGGLATRLCGDAERLGVRTSRASRIGVSGSLMSGEVEAGEIIMACGRHGYAGMTVVEGGRLNIAAALDPGFVRACGGPGHAVERTLREAGAPQPALTDVSWGGTPPLTRRPACVSLPRLLLVGDAAGYVEPFTGEGIAWAVAGAAAAAALAEEGAARWSPDLEREWRRRHRRLISARQGACRVAAWSLRRWQVRRAAVAAALAVPGLPRAAAAHLHRPYDLFARSAVGAGARASFVAP